jgi:hypothetical protein
MEAGAGGTIDVGVVGLCLSLDVLIPVVRAYSRCYPCYDGLYLTLDNLLVRLLISVMYYWTLLLCLCAHLIAQIRVS